MNRKTIIAGRRRSCRSRGGVALVLLALLLFVLCGAAAMTIDVGAVYEQGRMAQYAVDAGALAAARLLTAADSVVAREGAALAAENGLSNGDGVTVRCGYWDRSTKTFTNCSPMCHSQRCPCTSCADGAVNAVRVSAARIVPTTFGRVLGITRVTPAVEAIALRQNLPGHCIRPFGIVSGVLRNLLPGQTFTVGDASSNWGKLDIGGNMSSGTNFEDAMRYGTCNAQVAIGQPISSGTGFGGSISNTMDKVVRSSSQNGMIIAATSAFPQGNGSVNFEEFIEVDFLGQSRNGSNWQGTFRLVRRGVVPPTGASAERTPVLVK